MQPKHSDRLPDAVVRKLAARQHGIVYREQLLAAGLTPQQIRWRLRDGRLTALHRGVYLVGAVPSEHAYAQAALFACGPQAVLGLRSAMRIWGPISYPATAHPWVIVPPEARMERPKIVIKRAALQGRDIRHRHGMPLTSPPRTVLDMASLIDDPYELEWLVAEMAFLGLASEDELRDQLDRYKGRPGAGPLRAILALDGGPRRTRSKGERALLRALRERGVHGYETNARIGGYEVDFLWREQAFCVELDGWDGHSSRVAFERDREKWAELQAQGIAVMPVTGRRLRGDEEGIVRQILHALEHRRRRAA